MSKGKKKRQNNTNPQQQSIWKQLLVIGGYISAIGAIGGVGYGIGCWQCEIEHNIAVSELRRSYDEKITNLKIEYNKQILELQITFKNQKTQEN